jgi:ABC-type branched-subunit amino acid transport system substrate-binding protein
VIGQAPLSAADYASSGHWFTGAQVSYAYGAATYFRDETDVQKVVVFSYNLPGSISNRDTFMVPSLEAAGMEVEVVGIDYGAPDYTPFLAAAVASSPDLLYGFVQEADCTKLIVAADQLGYTGDIFAGNCGTFVTDVPDLADGVYTAGDMYAPSDLSQASERATADVGMYIDGMAEFAPDVAQSVFTQFAFAGVMNLRALLESVGPDDITGESAVAALEATTDTPSFMADTYGCSLQVVEAYPSICSASVLMFQGEGGQLVQVSDWIFGPDVFAAG